MITNNFLEKMENRYFERQKLNYFDVFRPQECQNRIYHEELLRIDVVNLSGNLVFDLVEKGWGTNPSVFTVPR